MKATRTALNLLIVPVSVFFIVLAVLPPASASDSGWSEFSIKLEEGQTKIVSLTVDNSAQITLVPLYAFEGVDSVVFFNPGAVGVGSSSILIHFTQMGATEKGKVAPDMYRVKLVATQADNKEFTILIYLELGETPPSGEILALSGRVDAFEARLQGLENMIELFENQLGATENLAKLIIAWDNQMSVLKNDLAVLSSDLQELKNNPGTNSGDIVALSNAVDALIQRQAEVSSQVSDLADIITANSADVEETKSGLATVYMIVIVLAIIVIGTALQRVPGIRKMKPIKMLTERQKKHSGPPVVIPEEDAKARAMYKAETEKREREKLGQ